MLSTRATPHLSIGMLRVLMAIETAIFGLASAIHRGLLLAGHAHADASVAESVIAVVLLAGLISTIIVPSRVKTIAIIAVGFALLGTVVGIVMIAIGVGPQTALDIAFHAVIALLLSFTVVLAKRTGR